MADETQFTTTVSRNEKQAVVALTGELDAFTAPRLRQTLVDLIDEGVTDLTLDLAALTFIDSTGLGVVIAALKRARTFEGDLRLRSASTQVRKILEITALTFLLEDA